MKVTYKIDFSLIYCFLLLTPLIKPEYLLQFGAAAVFYKFSFYALLVFCFLMLLKKGIKHNYPLLLFYGVLLFSTVYQHGEMKFALTLFSQFFCLLMICEIYRERIMIVIRALYTYLEFCLYINLATVLLYPDGFFSRFNEAYGYTKEYFLSSPNFFIFWILPALFLGMILKIKGQMNLRFLLFCCCMLLTQLYRGSATGLVIVVLFIVLNLLPLKRFFLIPFNLILADLLLYFIVLFGKQLKVIQYLVVDVLHRSLNFSNRDVIWRNAFTAVSQKKWFGYGVMNTNDTVFVLGRFNDFLWKGATHAHNTLLQIAFQTGLVGLGFYVLQIVYISIMISQQIQKGIFQAASITLFLFLLMGLTETSNFVILYICLILPPYLRSINEEEVV